MTTAQIEAGRELDALVAVEVMGWRQMANGWWERAQGAAPSAAGTPRYSTTGDGMLAVLERMRELGWRIELSYSPSQGLWFAYSTLATGEIINEIGAATLPHAVCLAALEAVRA